MGTLPLSYIPSTCECPFFSILGRLSGFILLPQPLSWDEGLHLVPLTDLYVFAALNFSGQGPDLVYLTFVHQPLGP